MIRSIFPFVLAICLSSVALGQECRYSQTTVFQDGGYYMDDTGAKVTCKNGIFYYEGDTATRLNYATHKASDGYWTVGNSQFGDGDSQERKHGVWDIVKLWLAIIGGITLSTLAVRLGFFVARWISSINGLRGMGERVAIVEDDIRTLKKRRVIAADKVGEEK